MSSVTFPGANMHVVLFGNQLSIHLLIDEYLQQVIAFNVHVGIDCVICRGKYVQWLGVKGVATITTVVNRGGGVNFISYFTNY